MKTIATIVTGITLALSLNATGPAFAVGGSFHCDRPPMMEVMEQVDGSSALQSIVNQYLVRWEARYATQQCQAYADGRPYGIGCMNGGCDWPAILASVPKDYFGRSNVSLAATVREDKRKGNGLREALAYCRSVGAIK